MLVYDDPPTTANEPDIFARIAESNRAEAASFALQRDLI